MNQIKLFCNQNIYIILLIKNIQKNSILNTDPQTNLL